MIDSRNAIIRKELSEKENPNKIVDIAEKVLNFNKQQKVKEIKMLQRLPVALAQVKAGNTSENLLNEIHQIIYFLYWEKKVTKKVCNNIMNLIKLNNRMDTISMNSGNSKTSSFRRLLPKLLDKIDLKRSDNMLLYQILAFTIHVKI